LSILIPLVGLVCTLALVIEIVLMLGRDILSGKHETEALKESIRKTQAELRGADKKLDALNATRRGAIKDAEASLAKIEDLQLARRAPEVPPVLIFVVGLPGAFRRFRGKITKTLPTSSAEADETQTLIWKHECIVEVNADNIDLARRDALRQFPEHNGYALGPLSEIPEATAAA
jgi:hypothetical protein